MPAVGRAGAAEHEVPVSEVGEGRPHLVPVRSPTSSRRARRGCGGSRGRNRRRARSSPGTTARCRRGSCGRNLALLRRAPVRDQRRPEQPVADDADAPGTAGVDVLVPEDRAGGLSDRSRPPTAFGHAMPMSRAVPSSCSQAMRSSTASYSRPGAPLSRTAAKSPSRRVISHSRTSAPNASVRRRTGGPRRSSGDLGLGERAVRLHHDARGRCPTEGGRRAVRYDVLDLDVAVSSAGPRRSTMSSPSSPAALWGSVRP